MNHQSVFSKGMMLGLLSNETHKDVDEEIKNFQKVIPSHCCYGGWCHVKERTDGSRNLYNKCTADIQSLVHEFIIFSLMIE